jgi:LuxR family maltose regulon positive regulatory protein
MAITVMDVLLATKLGVQVRTTRTVARERLRAELARAADARLVLVSAPAGFGKSTLLAEWVAGADLRTAWLTLDPGDNDVVRFARGLVAAAARLRDPAAIAVTPEPGPPPDPGLALANVLEAAADASADPATGGAVLVLDDYHLVDDPAVHALVGTLLERLPPRAVLAIATRADPPLPIARLRARGELVEVRAEDLRFTAAEAGDLLRAAGVELATDELDELTTRTEGWAAALRLAAVSLRGRSDHAELVRRFGASHRFVLDYVVEEVLQGLAPGTHDFLLRTSILERLSGPLCDAVTGRGDGQERLEELERLNLLIVPLDDERRWYRYHALFAEILRARLAALHPGEVEGLHARASAWHEARTNDDGAIHHALRAGDTEHLTRLVAEACGRHINAGELSTVRRWLEALPEDVVRGHAQLAAAYAWYWFLEHDVDAARGWLESAEQALAEGRDGGPTMRLGIPAQLAMLRSQMATFDGDTATAVEEAHRALELVPDGLAAEPSAILRGTARVLLAVALAGAGDTEAAIAAYEAGLPDLRAGGNALAAGRTVADLGRIAIERGDPSAAVRLCEAELARGDPATPASAAIWLALAAARAALGQPESSRDAARRSLDLATRAGDEPIAGLARARLAKLEAAATAAPAPSTAGRETRGPLLAGPDGPVERLTDRELEVLRLVALGRSNRQVAEELFVTVGTVKSHVHAISSKLGATNRTAAVARARDLGLLG